MGPKCDTLADEIQSTVKWSRYLSIGLNCLATLGIMLTCLASPGHFQPILAIAISCVLVISIGTRVISIFRNPTFSLLLPSTFILAAAIYGIVSIGNELKGNWIVLLGNLQVLGGWQVLVRFFVGFLTIGVLSIFCPSRALARWLSIFAFSGPGLLLLYLVRTESEAHWLDAETYKIQAVSIGIYFSTVVLWILFIRKSLILEKIHQNLGRKILPRILCLETSHSIDSALMSINGWVDPLFHIANSVDELIESKTLNSRKAALSKAFKILDGRSRVLPPWCRSRLETPASKKPEIVILLAEDSFLHKKPIEGSIRLAETMDELTLEVDWLVDAAFVVWDRNYCFIDAKTQKILLDQVESQKGDSKPALTALAMVALQQGLSPEITKSIEKDAEKDANAAFLSACSNLCKGSVQHALPHILAMLPNLPEIVVRRKLLPQLLAAAQENDTAKHQWFFLKDTRPQLLELIEAPLTSIYGGQIASWIFKQSDIEQKQTPVRFAVTGHGPSAICARVSAALFDLACERNCISDILLAGASFFNLTEELPPSRAPAFPGQEEFLNRLLKLAAKLNIEEEMIIKEIKTFLPFFSSQFQKSTIDTTIESLTRIEAEMGFIVNREININDYNKALDALNGKHSLSTNTSFPVLTEYRHNGEPLRVKIPTVCLGINDYNRVVAEYRRSIHEERHQEWERRRSKYEQWSRQFASSWHHLLADLKQGGMVALQSKFVYIHFEIDPETATETRIDPPQRTTEFEYLARLPVMIARQLAYWARADYRIELLAKEKNFEPHWDQTTLLDAFLRGWPLPSQDEKLNEAREQWQKKWRPLSILALNSALQEQGLDISDIAIENTVFRVVSKNGNYWTLGLYHIWDPHYDALPEMKANTTIFRPAFGMRKRTLIPADTAQKQAMETIQKTLANPFESGSELKKALVLDSGSALDFLLEKLCQPFVKTDLAKEIKRVTSEASNKIDPLITSGLLKKLDEKKQDILLLANDFGQAERRGNALPDFLAWELYLIGFEIKIVAEVLCKTFMEKLRTRPNLVGKDFWESLLGRSSTGIIASEIPEPTLPNHLKEIQSQLPPGMDVFALYRLSRLTAWQIINELTTSYILASTAKETLRLLNRPCPYHDLISQIRDSYTKLIALEPEYAKKCLLSSEPPQPSLLRQTKFAPGCFTGWDRVCYDIAVGDTALALAWTLREGTSINQNTLANLYKAVINFPICQTFVELIAIRDRLITDIEKFQKKEDLVSFDLASAAIRQVLMDVINIAESSYKRAALCDSEYGCAWLRLAKLKWLTARYRESLSIIIGFPSKADLQTCQVPLAAAVKKAGGNLSLIRETHGTWKNPANTTMIVSRNEKGHLTLCIFTSENLEIGKCAISGLSDKDMNILQEFFQRYQPDMLHSTGQNNFQEWVRLIQVPNLGQSAAIAETVQGKNDFALLAACIHLGVPDMLGLPPGSSQKHRPINWLNENVVCKLDWGK